MALRFKEPGVITNDDIAETKSVASNARSGNAAGRAAVPGCTASEP